MSQSKKQKDSKNLTVTTKTGADEKREKNLTRTAGNDERRGRGCDVISRTKSNQENLRRRTRTVTSARHLLPSSLVTWSTSCERGVRRQEMRSRRLRRGSLLVTVRTTVTEFSLASLGGCGLFLSDSEETSESETSDRHHDHDHGDDPNDQETEVIIPGAGSESVDRGGNVDGKTLICAGITEY